MTDTAQIACSITTTDPLAHLGLEIRLDSNTIFKSDHVRETINFVYDLINEDGVHQLEFLMQNKAIKDTVLDENNNIVKDARLIISNLTFDEIALNQLFVDQAVYTHDFNGTQSRIQTKFYGEMGCNGTVQLDFTTPVYLWLLEHM